MSDLLKKIKKITPKNGKLTKAAAMYYLGSMENFKNSVEIDWPVAIAGLSIAGIFISIVLYILWFLITLPKV